MTAIILSWAWKVITLAIGALGIFWAGARNARIKADLRNAKDYAKTMERMNEVDAMPVGDAREWLRKRGQQ